MPIGVQPTGLAGAAARGVAFQATMATGVTACAAIGWASLRVACRLRPSELELADCDQLTSFGATLATASLGAAALNAAPALFVAATAGQNELFGLELATAYLISSAFQAPCAALVGALLLGADANALFDASGIGCFVLLGAASGVALVATGLASNRRRRFRTNRRRCSRAVFAAQAADYPDASARMHRQTLSRAAQRAAVVAAPPPYQAPPPYTALPTERTHLFAALGGHRTYRAMDDDLERGELRPG